VTRLILSVLLVFAFAQSNLRADLCWTGGGDGVSLFQEANWIDTTTGMAPPANSVNGNVALSNSFGTVKMAGNGNYGPFGPNFDIGANFVDLSGGNLVSSATNAIRGINGMSTIKVSNSASIDVQFISNTDVILCDNAMLTFRGGNDPIANNTSIDLDAGWTGMVLFDNESLADATSEHLSSFTVNGSAAVLGVNVDIVSTGANSSKLVLISVPEPGSLIALCGLAIGFVFRRRRHC